MIDLRRPEQSAGLRRIPVSGPMKPINLRIAEELEVSEHHVAGAVSLLAIDYSCGP